LYSLLNLFLSKSLWGVNDSGFLDPLGCKALDWFIGKGFSYFLIAGFNNIKSRVSEVFSLNVQSPDPLVVKESFELSLPAWHYLSRFNFRSME